MKRDLLIPGSPMARIRGTVADLETENIALMAARAGDIADVITLWYGESDIVTPAFIRDAAKASLDRGETFYVPQMEGHPALARELAAYQTRLHGVEIGTDRSTITPGGMQSLHLALSLILEPGANAVFLEPQWPNIRHAIHLTGAEPRPVPLAMVEGRWTLDLDRVKAACDARTRAIVFSTPSNPCGWVASDEDLRALVAFSRKTGIWIVSDEMYARLYFSGDAAPSLLQHTTAEDLALCVNGFSKAWAMTGWRLGWLNHPASIAGAVQAMTQYVNSGTAPFVQAAGLAALRQGEPFVQEFKARCRDNLALVYDRLAGSNQIHLPERPEGGMYAFFSLEGEEDAGEACMKLLTQARVGLSPGHLFGAGSRNYLRMCVAVTPDLLTDACDRIARTPLH